MVELPGSESNEQTVVTEGYFEREVRLSAADTATFLRQLADQIDAGNELTVSSDDWEIPFRFGDPIEVEVEFLGERKRELEIELEFEWDEGGDGSLTVE
jgi:amphi-Trp domain-containing protein